MIVFCLRYPQYLDPPGTKEQTAWSESLGGFEKCISQKIKPGVSRAVWHCSCSAVIKGTVPDELIKVTEVASAMVGLSHISGIWVDYLLMLSSLILVLQIKNPPVSQSELLFVLEWTVWVLWKISSNWEKRPASEWKLPKFAMPSMEM